MKKTITLKSIIIILLRIIDYGVRLALIALVCLRGQYYNVICAVAGETVGSEYLLLKKELLQLTSGSSFFWELIMFFACVASATSFKYALYRWSFFRASGKLVILEKIRATKKRCFEKKLGEYKKPSFVISVFETVPALRN